MRKYILKRLGISLIILFFVALIIYSIMRCMPSSYVESLARQMSQKPGAKSYQEWLDQLNKAYGLDVGIVLWRFLVLECSGSDKIQTGNLVFFCAGIMCFHSGICDCNSTWNHFCQKTVQSYRLCSNSNCIDRYFTSQLLLCNNFEVYFLCEIGLV